MKYFIILFRSIFFYTLITIIYRIMGKREIGELSIMDFIVSIFITDMVVMSIENYNESIWISLIPIIILTLIQMTFSYLSLKSKNIKNVVDGKPSVIINKGKVNFEEMSKQRYNIDDLLSQLRESSVKSLDEVDYAILETNGKLSIFLTQDDKKRTYPLPLILDGSVEIETLKQIGKNKFWLDKELKKQGIRLEDIFYCFYRNKKLYIIEKNKI
ncbi:MAG: DUF421 domain-containing protein [Bacilli bacterium]|nr:DUF421 domain-containing protein [Bacilli bacterium]